MIPDEILLWIYLFSSFGGIAAGLGAMLLAVHLRMEVFGTKCTLLIILASLIALYTVPFICVWTMRNAYFHELLAEYPVGLHGIAALYVALPLVMWLGVELAKRQQPEMEEEAE